MSDIFWWTDIPVDSITSQKMTKIKYIDTYEGRLGLTNYNTVHPMARTSTHII